MFFFQILFLRTCQVNSALPAPRTPTGLGSRSMQLTAHAHRLAIDAAVEEEKAVHVRIRSAANFMYV